MGRLEPGSVVAGRYRLESLLGRGGAGSVFAARDSKLGGLVALKLPNAGGQRASVEKRFVREARIGAQLGRTPGFVRALDYGESDGTIFLVMDLVEGARPLELGTGSVAERAVRLREAGRLVALAHEKGVVHRDVKPENFLVGRDGTLRLSDFGLAKLTGAAARAADDEDLLRLTNAGAALGTPAYMPPEQLDDASAVDARADVYALGVMLFQALTGRVPFEGPASRVVFLQTQVSSGASPLPRPSELAPGVPPELDDLCARAMALDREQRLPSVAAFVAGLDAFLGGKGDGAGVEEGREPAGVSKLALAAGGVIVVGAVLAAFLVGRVARGVAAGPGPLPTVAPASSPTPRPRPTATPSPSPTPTPSPAGPPLPSGLTAGPLVELPGGRRVQLFLWTLPGDAGVLELVAVPGGWFCMGSDDDEAFDEEKPLHAHLVKAPYWIGRTPVTRGQYRAFCRETRTSEPRATFFDDQLGPDRDRHPVVDVSWTDAQAFCSWAGLALPTEAEWELAARGGGSDKRKYPWGDDWDAGNRCNYADASCPMDTIRMGSETALEWLRRVGWGEWDRAHDDGYAFTSPVGTYPSGASPAGALDMAGNVFQWCESWFEKDYSRFARGDMDEAPFGEGRALRGGNWGYPKRACRVTFRDWSTPEQKTPRIGFRVVLRSTRGAR